MLPPVNSAHRRTLAPIATPDRLLLGPGPSNAHPTVLQALARMPIGHLDPLYVELMGEVQELLRYVWQTDNRLTLPMSGTGSAAMEATIANMVEPGDTVLVAVKGYFGLRLQDMAGRYRQSGAAGSGPAAASNGEKHHMDLEFRKKVLRRFSGNYCSVQGFTLFANQEVSKE